MSAVERGATVKVLDHGYLKLVDWMGDDADIIRAARMSTQKDFEGWGNICKRCEANFPDGIGSWTTCPHCGGEFRAGDEKLLRYLYENRHDTPFEMVELAVEVQAPIMVFREWHRHRTQAYSEMSARYTQMPNLHYLPSVERVVAASRKQRNRQASGAGQLTPNDRLRDMEAAMAAQVGRAPDYGEEQIAAHVRYMLDQEQRRVYAFYEELLAMGVAPEIARIDTPVSRYSRMRAKTDLRNWLAFLTLRSDANAQWEIRQYSNALGYFVSKLFPRTWDLWLNADRRKPEIDKAGFVIEETRP